MSDFHNKITDTRIDPQLRMLMSIRHFNEDLNRYIETIHDSTSALISTYEKGVFMLENHAEPENKKYWEESINLNRVNVNQFNHCLEIMKENSDERDSFDFDKSWKDFENRRADLANSANGFEKLGDKFLPEKQKNTWDSQIKIYGQRTEPEIQGKINTVKFILQFKSRYNKENLVRINEIVTKNVPADISKLDSEALSKSYIKALREFQREFKPQNLWDDFMELLAGGVHPSPEERVSIMKQLDGEEKSQKYL